MRLKLQNIGIIEDATIDINGITLIAGQNDSGKSTVGKVLYALTRGINIDENRFNYSKVEFINSKFRVIRNLLSRTRAENETDKTIQDKFVKEFENSEYSYISRRSRHSIQVLDLEKLEEELVSISLVFSDFSNETVKKQLNTLIDDIKTRIFLDINDEKVLKYELETFFKIDFGNQIKGKFKDKETLIKIEGIKESQISFKSEIEIIDIEKNSFFYDDVIFIESPLLLEKRTFFFNNRPLYDKNEYLNSKIHKEEEIKDVFSDDSDKINSFLVEINSLINGIFDFDDLGRLIFNKKDTEFDLINVATGIKTFGILQLLLQKGEINSNSLLIIDEPEVHLHPTWQVKFAEILVKLSKELNIQMVLTSHSPYFIEALEAYSKKYKYEGSTNFYFAEKNEDGLSSKIIDVTKNITPILSSISDAFYTIQDINDED